MALSVLLGLVLAVSSTAAQSACSDEGCQDGWDVKTSSLLQSQSAKKRTRGSIFTAPEVNLSLSASSQDRKSQRTSDRNVVLVSGAGSVGANGEYGEIGKDGTNRVFVRGEWRLFKNKDTSNWVIRKAEAAYYRTEEKEDPDDGGDPPTTKWEVVDYGAPPAPMVQVLEETYDPCKEDAKNKSCSTDHHCRDFCGEVCRDDSCVQSHTPSPTPGPTSESLLQKEAQDVCGKNCTVREDCGSECPTCSPVTKKCVSEGLPSAGVGLLQKDDPCEEECAKAGSTECEECIKNAFALPPALLERQKTQEKPKLDEKKVLLESGVAQQDDPCKEECAEPDSTECEECLQNDIAGGMR